MSAVKEKMAIVYADAVKMLGLSDVLANEAGLV